MNHHLIQALSSYKLLQSFLGAGLVCDPAYLFNVYWTFFIFYTPKEDKLWQTRIVHYK